FFSSRRRHTRFSRDWSSDVCSSDLIGDPGLDSETANRLELGLHWHHGPLALQLAAFHVRYDDFIHLSATGIDDGGPVHAWNQARSEERRVGKASRCGSPAKCTRLEA